MILYLDASALVKRFVQEEGSSEVTRLWKGADSVGTGVLSRAEVPAALGKAVRMEVIGKAEGLRALESFRALWADLVRVHASESLLARADVLAWDLGLRGYDAVHLASALAWQDGLGEPVTFMTFDRKLADSGRAVRLMVAP
jgi:predicted nucleic acid-binding protein